MPSRQARPAGFLFQENSPSVLVADVVGLPWFDAKMTSDSPNQMKEIRAGRQAAEREIIQNVYAHRYAEGPRIMFMPAYLQGNFFSNSFDDLLGRLMTWAPTMSEAIDLLEKGLEKFQIAGVQHNIIELKQNAIPGLRKDWQELSQYVV